MSAPLRGLWVYLSGALSGTLFLNLPERFRVLSQGLALRTLCDALYPARWHLSLQCDSWVQDTFRSVSAYALPLSLPASVECPLPVSLSVRLSVCLSPSTSLCVCHSLLHWPLGLPLPPLSICLSPSSSYLSVSISMSLSQGISLSPPSLVSFSSSVSSLVRSPFSSLSLSASLSVISLCLAISLS